MYNKRNKKRNFIIAKIIHEHIVVWSNPNILVELNTTAQNFSSLPP